MTELAKEIDEYLENNGIKKVFVAEKLGITKQSLYNLMSKKNFSENDANKILNVLNKKIKFEIVDND